MFTVSSLALNESRPVGYIVSSPSGFKQANVISAVSNALKTDGDRLPKAIFV